MLVLALFVYLCEKQTLCILKYTTVCITFFNCLGDVCQFFDHDIWCQTVSSASLPNCHHVCNEVSLLSQLLFLKRKDGDVKKALKPSRCWRKTEQSHSKIRRKMEKHQWVLKLQNCLLSSTSVCPSIKPCRLIGFRKCPFSVAAPIVWSDLPPIYHWLAFRKAMKSWLGVPFWLF